MNNQRTLLYILHGIGDQIMATGVIKQYHKEHPEELIDLVVPNSNCEEIWKNNPFINEVFIYNKRQVRWWNPFVSWFDKIYLELDKIERQHYLKYTKILAPGIQQMPELFYNIFNNYGKHKIIRLCEELKVMPDLYNYDLYIDENSSADLPLYSPLAIIHPFSGDKKKNMDNSMIENALFSLYEMGYEPRIVGSIKQQNNWIGYFGLSISKLLFVLKNTKIFVGTDSMVAHLAAYANVPDITIITPNSHPERYIPMSKHSKIHLINF
jgi:ADP-heptose:LPS heptosyltransferase